MNDTNPSSERRCKNIKLLTREVFLWRKMNEILEIQRSEDTVQERAWMFTADVVARNGQLQDLDLDEHEDDPGKKSCPTGGCPPDKKIYRDIYDDSMQQVAKKNNLDLNDPEQKSRAHRLILPLFRQRVREDKKYTPQDKEGPPDSMGPEFTIKDGRIYYLAFQKSLQQMYEDQKRLRPWQYDPKEHATMTLMEQAFVHGATRVSHISHNKNDQGVDSIRDEITMVFDAETGKGKMEIKNLATDGYFLDTKEAYDKMKRSHPDRFIEGHPTDGVFILSDIPMESKEVHEVLSRHGATNISDSIMLSEQTWDVNDNENITIKPDYISTIQSPVVEYVEDHLTRGIDRFITYVHDIYEETVVPAFMRKLLDLPIQEDENKILVSIGDALTVTQLTIAPFVNEQNESSDTLVSIWRERAEKVLDISPEKSEELLLVVQETWTMMTDAKEVISFVNDTGVGIAAAFYAIEMMTIAGVEKHEEEELEVWGNIEQEKDIISFVVDTDVGIAAGLFVLNEWAMRPDTEEIVSPLVLNEEESDEAFSLEKIPDSVDAVVLKETIEFVRVIDALPAEEQKKAIVEEKEKVEKTIIQIWEAIIVDKPAVALIHTLTELVDLEPKDEHEKQFSFAFVVWIMLKLMNYHSALETLEAFVKPDQDSPLETRIQKQKPEGLIQKETGQWLLFAIIWYLAMIREQGMHTQQAPLAQKKKKAKEVIIFAYTS